MTTKLPTARSTNRARKDRETALRRLAAMIAATGVKLEDMVPTDKYIMDAPGKKWHGMALPGAFFIAAYRRYTQ